MNDRRHVWLIAVFLVLFAITRWPGSMPVNFSASYALMFCAGVYFRNRAGWWVPLVLMAVTDIALNFYYTAKGYPAFQWYQFMNYPVYLFLIWFGRRFDPRASIGRLVGGSLLGAVLFYLITNTAAWFFNPFGNPEYTKTLAGWWRALTTGTGGWPQTWEFFRNTLLSSALFTALFAGAMKYSERLESAEEKNTANAAKESQEGDAETEESAA